MHGASPAVSADPCCLLVPCIHPTLLLPGARGASFVFTWLRLSATQALTWQRAYSYTPRDITRAQQQVAEAVTALARAGPGPEVRLWARRTLARLSRGGGNGDEIRMGILNIMRDFGIAEGNRPVRRPCSGSLALLYVP